MITRLAHYSILEKIGAGGMGEVYLALDTRLDRKMTFLKVDPKWNNLRSDQRFAEILRQAGF